MNICLVHEEYPEETNFGGIATYQKACAEEYVRQGHGVYVICRGLTKNQSYIENGVNIFRIYVEKTENQIDDYVKYRKLVCEKLLELQNDNKIDIIEVPDWGAETVLFEEFRKIPLVARLHTPLKVWLKYNKNKFGDVTNLMLDWEDKMLKSANLITCCSNALKKLIVKDFKIKPHLIKVTPNPANLVNFYYDKSIEKENVVLYVGSLEERKGVLVLAKALNKVFEKFPNFKARFIGKDTTRNNLNISTVEYIKQLVDEKHRDKLEFLGQLKNFELNSYINKAKCAVYPSLFDNFPYVVLETMATGTPIVGSKNSGMVEMLEDNTSIYKTGNSHDLAIKIINTLQNKTFEKRNIDRVNYFYNSKQVCGNMLQMYETTIKEYFGSKITLENFEQILKLSLSKQSKVLNIGKEYGGVANKVYNVQTECGKTYIIKQYMYDYDFSLSNMLYNAYLKNNINVVKPINTEPIYMCHCYFNVFEYLNKDAVNCIDDSYLQGLILTDRLVKDRKIEIVNKCQNYYNGILNLDVNEKFLKEDCKFVQNVFNEVKDKEILKERYLNHGDISYSNIISNNNKLYLIDFDETLVAPKLYDFAVITIKIFTKNGKLNKRKFNQFFANLKNKLNYTNDDYLTIIKFYLCKILLEKFYLHYTNKINLKSKTQKKDYYLQYVKLLKYFTSKREL